MAVVHKSAHSQARVHHLAHAIMAIPRLVVAALSLIIALRTMVAADRTQIV